jgi:hypothetical protein
MDDPKATLQRYLQVTREAMVWKLDGLTEYDLRRPLTPTGTNLLGLVKHVAFVETGYLGDVFGRPLPDKPTYFETAITEPNADMWATPDESSEWVLDLYRRVWAHDDATIDELALDAPGRVPWWGEHGDVTLHRMIVHVIAETNRHAGHADIVRELIDGAAGLRPDVSNMASDDPNWWADYHARVEDAAATFRDDG